MKKLTLIATIAMTAGLLQAATFAWSTAASLNSQNTNPVDAGYTSSSTTFQLVFFGGTEPVVGTNFDWNNVANAPTSGTEVPWDAGFGYFYNTGTASGSYSAPEASINGWYGVVILDAATPNYYGFDKFEVVGLTEQSVPPDFNATSTDAGAYEPVPEPTSLALIGLGAAAIALRKRFGKKV